ERRAIERSGPSTVVLRTSFRPRARRAGARTPRPQADQPVRMLRRRSEARPLLLRSRHRPGAPGPAAARRPLRMRSRDGGATDVLGSSHRPGPLRSKDAAARSFAPARATGARAPISVRWARHVRAGRAGGDQKPLRLSVRYLVGPHRMRLGVVRLDQAPPKRRRRVSHRSPVAARRLPELVVSRGLSRGRASLSKSLAPAGLPAAAALAPLGTAPPLAAAGAHSARRHSDARGNRPRGQRDRAAARHRGRASGLRPAACAWRRDSPLAAATQVNEKWTGLDARSAAARPPVPRWGAAFSEPSRRGRAARRWRFPRR